MIDDYQLSLICMVETHMQIEEEFQMPCYSLVNCNGRSADSGVTPIRVRDNMKNTVRINTGK